MDWFYCLRTADKAPDVRVGSFLFLRILQAKKRADERTRTADLLIGSELSYVYRRLPGLRIPHKQADIRYPRLHALTLVSPAVMYG
jgi:hypothetical protein